ncbi:fumarylacetoacetase [Herbaspirillum sp. RTI4]|uniref:fumarylacetoacetase n=1 Tax=Herbaspirillum sp. RTI4 TaxID=3048640 RepID=UPI002AB4EDF1|nr:fumarylacetoacetase [Herbaspirillum sp. RTI4]MDY7577798.1 fumarylacetoacetase [Herbaspirillum sp. RTI4]MEA9980774.1 fumarylacetoacetase [Herbaspirillum sp. RTI4]
MTMALNETHAPELRSWVESANQPGSDFPIQNLPFGVFRRRSEGAQSAWHVGVAIGDAILDLHTVIDAGAFSAEPALAQQALKAAGGESLNALMALNVAAWSALRLSLSRSLRVGSPVQSTLQAALVAQKDVEFALPAQIGDYTDFYTSVHHATAIGKLFRPDQPLLPNYKWVPIGYHGRSSSIAVGPQQFRRPLGQTKPPEADAPVFGPSKRMDYEMEVGIFIGSGNAPGDAIALDQAEANVFGLCLLNDWSARDIQAWEYQPLGPFLAKNFASTISPWVVTLEALAPYRLAWSRDAADPQPLPYLDSAAMRESGAFDIELEVALQTSAMRQAAQPPQRLSLSNFRYSYWSVSQLVTHHTVGGCNLRPGDLLGSGTQSGPAPSEAGSLLELSAGGKQPIQLTNGESRTFLEDGDTVVMRAWAQRPGLARIGFGELSGTLLPARTA